LQGSDSGFRMHQWGEQCASAGNAKFKRIPPREFHKNISTGKAALH
jgi:hypothetical protein